MCKVSVKARFSYFHFLHSLITTTERGDREERIQCLKPLLPPPSLSPLFSAADDKKFPMVEQIGRGGDGGHSGLFWLHRMVVEFPGLGKLLLKVT